MQLETPIGPLTVTATKKAVTAIRFGTQVPEGSARCTAAEATPLLRKAAEEIGDYFAGSRRRFTLPLAPEGTPFQQKVWEALRNHPLRRNPHLQTDRHPDRPQPVVPGRRHGQQPQSDRDCRPLPSCHRLRRQTHGICRRTRHQRATARIGKTVVRRHPERQRLPVPPRKHPCNGPRSGSSR